MSHAKQAQAGAPPAGDPVNGRGPAEQQPSAYVEIPPRYARGGEVVAIAVAGAVAGVLLLATLIAVFPAAVEATQPNVESVTVPLLFGLTSFEASSDTAMLLLVVFASAVGSYVHVATSFTNYAGRNRLETSWLSWYALRCLIGATLATVFYFVLRAGFFNGDASNAAVNAYGIAAVAGFVGLFSRQATDKLKELFDTMFKTDSSEEDVDPVINDVSPDPVKVGDEGPHDLTVEGSGFMRLSQVRVAGQLVTPRSVGRGLLIVRLSAADLVGLDHVDVTVVNPGPCSTSNRYRVGIATPAAEPVNEGSSQSQ